MLSYQHAYHAGNLADVHKHIALTMLVRRLQLKDDPLCYVDSHAGRGVYDLDSAEARKTAEADCGILRLTAGAGAPDAVRDYLSLVAGFNAPGSRRRYPGSAALAQVLLRERDRAILLELHPQELAALRQSVGGDRRVSVHARDCFEGLPALLPPKIRRGLVLIDPSYELKRDYDAIAVLLGKALERWASGVYLLWYPLLPGARHRRLLGALEAAAWPKMLISEYRYSSAGAGLGGSGLVIVNAPWQFDDELADAMEHVVRALDPGGGRHERRWLGMNPARGDGRR
ncbi:MAG TPA: 23S rRNA (adenine(2030)-N(6))-methyltransferase RlmJ [Gammaproteobacteria bacterium]|nr:23S rRNA (adenine(2030)-N(6))-methyltransferase RlmJ [Gammaproteobacteria bacterium]